MSENDKTVIVLGKKKPNEVKNERRRIVPFMERASTALCLIRDGINTTYPLMRYLGYKSSSGVRSLVSKMTEYGWVEEDVGLCATLRLTDSGREMVRHISLATPAGFLTRKNEING